MININEYLINKNTKEKDPGFTPDYKEEEFITYKHVYVSQDITANCNLIELYNSQPKCDINRTIDYIKAFIDNCDFIKLEEICLMKYSDGSAIFKIWADLPDNSDGYIGTLKYNTVFRRYKINPFFEFTKKYPDLSKRLYKLEMKLKDLK